MGLCLCMHNGLLLDCMLLSIVSLYFDVAKVFSSSVYEVFSNIFQHMQAEREWK